MRGKVKSIYISDNTVKSNASIALNCFYQILEKVAEKFAKKSNFSYIEAYDNLSKKEQKLTLDRICRKFLKSDESDTTDTNRTKEKSNKRTIDGTGSDGEDGSESPRPKKVRSEEKQIEKIYTVPNLFSSVSEIQIFIISCT